MTYVSNDERPRAFLVGAIYTDDEGRITQRYIGPWAKRSTARASATVARRCRDGEGHWSRCAVPKIIDTIDGPATFTDAFVVEATAWKMVGKNDYH